jgi:hypothetical protein
MPEWMYVVLGRREPGMFRYLDFAAYVARVRRRFLEVLEADLPWPYPYPVEHCNYGDWHRRRGCR